MEDNFFYDGRSDHERYKLTPEQYDFVSSINRVMEELNFVLCVSTERPTAMALYHKGFLQFWGKKPPLVSKAFHVRLTPFFYEMHAHHLAKRNVGKARSKKMYYARRKRDTN